MANEENLKKGKPFKKGHDSRRNTEGRPKSFEKYLKEQFDLDTGITFDKTSVLDTIENLIYQPVSVLEKIKNNKSLPGTLSTIASAVLKDRESGKMSTIETIWDRVYGKAMETVKTENKTTIDLGEDNILHNDEKMLKVAEHIRNNARSKRED